MITKDWKISHLLETYPQTLEVLVSASKHFRKLNNPLLRKALATRVTIEQAAAIGGVDLRQLLEHLRTAVGELSEEEIASAPESQESELGGILQKKPQRLDFLPREKVVLLDVRPIIEAGTDPFKTIIKTVKTLGRDQVLHLINSFEPIPLYTVLSERGMEHWTERRGGEWHVFFWRVINDDTLGKKKRADSEPSMIDTCGTEVEESKMVELDVRGLAPPEPMVRILETLPKIDANTILLVHHHREPMMLYEKLQERGYEAITNRIEEDYYRIVIRKRK